MRALAAVPGRLPRGVALPEGVWRTRHRWVTTTLLAHLPVLAAWSLVRGVDPGQYALLLVPAALWAASRLDAPTHGRLVPPRALASCAATAGLMSCASYLVDVSGGYIEAHFHFFVLVPVAALYEAWPPFLLAVAIVLIEHGVVGTLWPHAVFGHSMAQMEHPWLFAAIHAGFFAAAALGSLVTWRLAEASRLEQLALLGELHHRAHHDALTGLANRTSLAQAVHGELARGPGDGSGRPVSVLMMDLDRFKEVNDTLGHAAGDQLLRDVGGAMREVLAAVAPEALLARLGGDEFAVLLPGHDARAARRVAEALAEVVIRTRTVAGVDVSVGASIGIASCAPDAEGYDALVTGATTGARRSGAASPGAGSDAPDELSALYTPAGVALMRRADVAMYQAKTEGTGVAGYDPGRDRHTSERLNTLNDLRQALEADDQIVLHYQPKVSLADGRLVGVEALARWQHPTRGMLPPGEFVQLAQSTMHAEAFTRRVIDLALRQSALWWSHGHGVPVAINVTPRCLLRPVFVPALTEALDQHRVAPHLLRLEITEDAIIGDPDAAVEVLNELRGLGVTISIDDFGTGFSSLSYLRRLPVDELKIDRSFVTGLGLPGADAGADEVLVASIVELAHRLGMHVVAEGVEQEHEAAVLRALRCDSAQGWLFGRPVPADALPHDLVETTRVAVPYPRVAPEPALLR